MFCPTCGFEYTQKTNYCKRCGEGLNSTQPVVEIKPPRLLAAGLFLVAALFGIIGLGINLSFYHELIMEVITRGIPTSEPILVFKIGMMLVGVLDGLLIWQLSRVITAFQKSAQSQAPERIIIREVQTPQIGVSTDPLRSAVEPPSVVEQTTRQFANRYESPKVEEKTGTR